MTREELVKILDKAAARATLNGKTGATAKQSWYLASLIEEAESPLEIGDDSELTMELASEWIDALKAAMRIED